MYWTKTNNSLTVFHDGRLYTANDLHPKWIEMMSCLQENDEFRLLSLFSIKSAIEENHPDIKITGNSVTFMDQVLVGYDVEKLLGLIKERLPIGSLTNFLAKKMKNPSKKSVEQLYRFLEHRGKGSMPLTKSGNFVAYRGVRSDYFSINSGKLTLLKGKQDSCGRVYNGIGEEVLCPREQVTDNPDIPCGPGFHVGSLEYAKGWAGGGGRVVIVEVDPVSVVSVPRDCSEQKMRVCGYRVIDEYKSQVPDTYFKKPNDSQDWNTFVSKVYDTGYSVGFEDGKQDGPIRKWNPRPAPAGEAYLDGYDDGYAQAYSTHYK